MNSKYEKWIQNYDKDIHRKCIEVSNEMEEEFPELIIAKGLVRILENNKWYQHQWLEDESGNIIDPTKEQWLKIVEYKKINDDDPKPIGKCYNCGEWVFDNNISSSFCNNKCSSEYKDYLNAN